MTPAVVDDSSQAERSTAAEPYREFVHSLCHLLSPESFMPLAGKIGKKSRIPKNPG
jgi:hypothetical protein